MTADNTRTGPTRLAKHLSGPVEKKTTTVARAVYIHVDV